MDQEAPEGSESSSHGGLEPYTDHTRRDVQSTLIRTPVHLKFTRKTDTHIETFCNFFPFVRLN